MENEIELYEWLERYTSHMENEIELYEWKRRQAAQEQNSIDLYAPGGMKRERYYERDEDDDYDYDADWRHEDAYNDSSYEDHYDYEDLNSSWD